MFEMTSIRKQTAVISIALLILAGVTGAIMANGYGEIQASVIVLTGIGIIAVFLIPRLSNQEERDFLPKVLFWGLIARITAVFIRIWIDFGMGVSVSDAIGYMRTGNTVAQHIWHLEFSQLLPFIEWGIPFTGLVTGIVFSLIGITQNGGYLVFCLVSFVGSYFFYRAYVLAFPDANKRFYALLVFFLPSILYWANGIGKDSLIFLFIGLCAYGGAQYLLRQKFIGLIILVLSLVGVFYIRPHISVLLAVSLFAGYCLQGVRQKHFRRFSFYLVVISAGLVILLILPRIAGILGVPGLSITEVLTYLTGRQELTAIGGSTFAAIDVSNPLNIPVLVITILFRPFPWEAHNIQAIMASVEGVVLAGMAVWRFRSIRSAFHVSVSNGYILFILVYITAFILAFSAIQNFGILVRQRTMLYPFIFMLMAYAPSSQAVKRNAEIPEAVLAQDSS